MAGFLDLTRGLEVKQTFARFVPASWCRIAEAFDWIAEAFEGASET